jgi:hypothetical protein
LIPGIPVSFVEIYFETQCALAASDVAASIDPSQLRFIRAAKPLRYLKLARILKLSHFAHTVSSVCDWIGMLGQDKKRSLN